MSNTMFTIINRYIAISGLIFIIFFSFFANNAKADWVGDSPSILVPHTFEFEFDSNSVAQCEAAFFDPLSTILYWGIAVMDVNEAVIYQSTSTDATIPQTLSYTLQDLDEVQVMPICYFSVDLFPLDISSQDIGRYDFFGSSYAEPSFYAFQQVEQSTTTTSSSSDLISIAGDTVFRGWVIFMSTMIFVIWFFGRKNI